MKCYSSPDKLNAFSPDEGVTGISKMNKLKMMFGLIGILIAINCSGQGAVKVTFRHPSDENCVGYTELNTNKYVIGANSNLFSNQNTLFSVDSNGNLYWYRSFSYRGASSEDILNSITSQGDSIIYCGGNAAIWNFAHDPVLFKFNPNGELLFDSAYENPSQPGNSFNMEGLKYESQAQKLISVSSVAIGSVGYMNIQEFNSSGARLRNQFVNKMHLKTVLNWFLTDSGKTITAICDSSQGPIRSYLFFYKFDSSGNTLVSKNLGFMEDATQAQTRNKSIITNDGKVAFLIMRDGILMRHERVLILTSNGDSITTIDLPDSVFFSCFVKNTTNGCTVAGQRLVNIDTSFKMNDLGSFNRDSVYITECSLSSNGKIYGIGRYSGNRGAGTDDYDMYFFISDRNKKLEGNIKTLHTGLSENVYQKSEILFPNPTSGNLEVRSTNEIAEIRVYNLLGKLEMTCQNTNVINVAMLNSGIYIIEIVERGHSNRLTRLKFKKD